MSGQNVSLIFPGQGAQHHGMGVGLYRDEPVFRAAMDSFFAALDTDGDQLRDEWLSAVPGPLFDDASRAQPLLFGLGYSLGAAVIARGVTPSSLIGHSVGELAAAAVAKVFDVGDAGRIMAGRSRAMTKTVPGGMVAVAGAVGDVVPHLVGDVVVGAVNTPRQVVLTGPAEELQAVVRALTAHGFACQPARARQAFHSPVCAGAAVEFEAAFDGVRLSTPEITVVSTRTGLPVGPEQARTPEFWAAQLALPVQFWAALDTLLAVDGTHVLLEAGPGGSCAAMTRRHPAVREKRAKVLPLLPPAGQDPGLDVDVFDRTLTQLATVLHV
ncbi:acyltransferase domain-containing protein [Saccharothrix sp. S26]|uniref:acyltransferase domain-containing protein n=1 Tax=Saccharothrix sp. S26 TaxID=2907215 RepID=UPI002278925E|nr:acyltransferase domain-containing protein [Saccharothrix sp. S26]